MREQEIGQMIDCKLFLDFLISQLTTGSPYAGVIDQYIDDGVLLTDLFRAFSDLLLRNFWRIYPFRRG